MLHCVCGVKVERALGLVDEVGYHPTKNPVPSQRTRRVAGARNSLASSHRLPDLRYTRDTAIVSTRTKAMNSATHQCIVRQKRCECREVILYII